MKGENLVCTMEKGVTVLEVANVGVAPVIEPEVEVMTVTTGRPEVGVLFFLISCIF